MAGECPEATRAGCRAAYAYLVSLGEFGNGGHRAPRDDSIPQDVAAVRLLLCALPHLQTHDLFGSPDCIRSLDL